MSIPVPTSDVEAMDMYRTGLSYLAAADPTAMAAQAQAEFLKAFEQGDAMSTAARAQILVAFTASQGRPEPAAGHWLLEHHPARHPQCGHPPR